jgi:hypothetical protein
MLIRTAIENNVEGRSLAWALEHPGCYAYGPDGETALESLPAAWRSYLAWFKQHNTTQSWLSDEPAELRLEETWDGYTIDEQFERAEQGYEVNAWFLHDWKPLAELDIERGLYLLTWSRLDLLATVAGLSEDRLNQTYPEERWSITGILNHIAGAEWWYLDRLGLAFPRSEVPEQPFERLEKVRSYLIRVLPGLAGSKQVTGVYGELWSPCKLLRRAAWHELDHLAHIRKLL